MYALNKPYIIERVLEGLEMTASTFDYAESMKAATFPSGVAEWCAGLEKEAEETWKACDAIIRSIGGIPVKQMHENTQQSLQIIGIRRYQEGNWHFCYAVNQKMADDLLAGTAERLREVYRASFSGEGA